MFDLCGNASNFSTKNIISGNRICLPIFSLGWTKGMIAGHQNGLHSSIPQMLLAFSVKWTEKNYAHPKQL